MKHVMIIVLLFLSQVPCVFSGMDDLHGDQIYELRGLHNGNNVQTHFFNSGMFGRRGTATVTTEIHGEWPKGSGHLYFTKIVLIIGAQVVDVNGKTQNILSECHGTATDGVSGSSGDTDPLNRSQWWTMTPLPGFANYEATDIEGVDENSVAMSHLPWSWPQCWPDKEGDLFDPGWCGQWNSYFAKGFEYANADQESYFVIDDYQNREFEFYPDSTDSLRRGLGIRVQIRGLQWNNPLVRDVLFIVYDVTNIGTHNHNKINFIKLPGYTLGLHVNNSSSESEDDKARFDKDERFIYFYDGDDRGNNNYDVGLSGYTLFETPGNPKDGIDNDGDGFTGSGIVIDESMFEPRRVDTGDEIILTDYYTFERTKTVMPDDTVRILFQGRQRPVAWPGKTLEEVPFDNIDNDLNGLIDENNGALADTSELTFSKYVYVGRKAVDYFSGNGLDNLLIDERRDNEIDEDNDWNMVTDDVGMDGAPNSLAPDFGEGDGSPTSGYLNGVDTGLPGEPNIDKTDIDESDLIGMTSFYMLTPWDIHPLFDDEGIWRLTVPGTIYAPQDVVWVNSVTPLMGSGYFPLIPDDIERFSGAFVFADDEISLYNVKNHAETAYKEDYHFFRAPNKPIARAVPGDGRVTLYWDSGAERSRDPIAGYDFEGYRIYRSTDPQWRDMKQITNAYGTVIMQQPLVIFDLEDGINGLSSGVIDGVQYYIGDDSGLQHSYIDTAVTNGITYYYAVVSFDRGVDSLAIPPTECSRQLTLGQSGEIIDISSNVVVSTPRAPVAGYVSAVPGVVEHLSGSADGTVEMEIVDPGDVKDGHRYRVTFTEQLVENERKSESVVITDVTEESPVTVLAGYPLSVELNDTPVVDGFQLLIVNPQGIEVDTIRSVWNSAEVLEPEIGLSSGAVAMPVDCQVIFGEVGIGQSLEIADVRSDSMAVNFKIVDIHSGEEVPFGFRERDLATDEEEGMFTSFTLRNNRDEIYILGVDSLGQYIESYRIRMAEQDTLKRLPQAGDTLSVFTTSPFLSNDTLEFVTSGPRQDKERAKNELDAIRVVPNPYIVTNSYEPANPYARGRGPRELHFTHLPKRCTIKIFDIRGQLIRTLERDSALDNGTEVWDMLTRDNMEIGFGVYIYYVDAEGIGQRTGKFAVIK